MPTDASSLVIVALGSNLGDSQGLVRTAMDRLEQFSRIPLLRSSLFVSTPVDCPPDAPQFVNAVVGLTPDPSETPESLLGKLKSLEREFGRRPKTIPNESRTLDLDLIAFGLETRATKELILPHPRVHLRRFVLEPLAEIAPDLVLPGQKLTATNLLATLGSTEKVERLG